MVFGFRSKNDTQSGLTKKMQVCQSKSVKKLSPIQRYKEFFTRWSIIRVWLGREFKSVVLFDFITDVLLTATSNISF